jgi:hypothetical protein
MRYSKWLQHRFGLHSCPLHVSKDGLFGSSVTTQHTCSASCVGCICWLHKNVDLYGSGDLYRVGAPLKVSIDQGGITAITTHADGCVRLYHLQTGQLMWKAGGHGAAAEAACVTPDCRHMVTVAGDGCMMVWKLPQALASQMQQQVATLMSAQDQQLSDGGSGAASPRHSASSGTSSAGVAVANARTSGDGAGSKKQPQQKPRGSVEGSTFGGGKARPKSLGVALEKKGRKDSSESMAPASPSAVGKGAALSAMPRLQERPLPNRVPDRAAAALDSRQSPRIAATPAVAGEQMVRGRMTPETVSMPMAESRFPARPASAGRVLGPDKGEPAGAAATTSEPPGGKGGGSRGATPERLRGAILGVVDAVLARVPSRSASRNGHTSEHLVTATREIPLEGHDSESPSHAGTSQRGIVDYSGTGGSEQVSSPRSTSQFGGSQRSLKSIINRKNLKDLHASQSQEYYMNGGESFGEDSMGCATGSSSVVEDQPGPETLRRMKSGIAMEPMQRTKSGSYPSPADLQRMRSWSPEPPAMLAGLRRKSLDGAQYKASPSAAVHTAPAAPSAHSRSRSATPTRESQPTSDWTDIRGGRSSGMRKSQSGTWMAPSNAVPPTDDRSKPLGDTYATYRYQQEAEEAQQQQHYAYEMQIQARDADDTLIRRVKQGRPLVSHNHLPRWAARASPSVDVEVPSSRHDGRAASSPLSAAAPGPHVAKPAAVTADAANHSRNWGLEGEPLQSRGSKWSQNKDEQFSVFSEKGRPVLFQVG